MKKRVARGFCVAVMLAGGGVVSSCSGPFTSVAPVAPPTSYSVVGRTEGSACGFLFYSLVPIFVNGRTERAYNEALAKVRAEFLVDTELTDRWYYAGVGIVLCTTVAGTGARHGAASPMPSAPVPGLAPTPFSGRDSGAPMPPSATPVPAQGIGADQAAKPPPAVATPSPGGLLPRLRALKAEHDSGQLSDADYESKRQQVIDEVMHTK